MSGACFKVSMGLRQGDRSQSCIFIRSGQGVQNSLRTFDVRLKFSIINKMKLYRASDYFSLDLPFS